MPSNKVHYAGKQSCNSKGFYPRLSTNVEEVTCRGCLNIYHQKTKGGRPPKTEATVEKVAFSLSPAAYQKLQLVPKGDRSGWVSKLIEES